MNCSEIAFASEVGIDSSVVPLEFWCRLFSDLCADDIRDIFAGWMVGTLLGLQVESSRRMSWVVRDFILPDQTRIGVKSSALGQSRKQTSADGSRKTTPPPTMLNPNRVRFGGLQARSAVPYSSGKTEPRFKSDFYVFCLYGQTDPADWDAWSVANWKFYMMTREELEGLNVGDSVSLAILRKFRPPMSTKEFQSFATSRLSKHLNQTDCAAGFCETCAERGRPNEPVYKMGMCKFCYKGLRHPKATREEVAKERGGQRPGMGTSSLRKLRLGQ